MGGGGDGLVEGAGGLITMLSVRKLFSSSSSSSCGGRLAASTGC